MADAVQCIIEVKFKNKENVEPEFVRFYDDEQGTLRWFAERYSVLYTKYGALLDARPGRTSARIDSLYGATSAFEGALKAFACYRLGFVLGRGAPVFVSSIDTVNNIAIFIKAGMETQALLAAQAAKVEPRYVKIIRPGDITDWSRGLGDDPIAFIT